MSAKNQGMSNATGIPDDAAVLTRQAFRATAERALVALLDAGSLTSTETDHLATLREAARVAVSDLAALERSAGAAPEQLVVLVKQIASDAYYCSEGSAGAAWLREDLMRWAIEAYYKV